MWICGDGRRFNSTGHVTISLAMGLGAGCLPVITHSPRLETGYTGGMITGYETDFAPPTSRADSVPGLPYLGVFIARSYVDSASGWGVSVSLATKMMFAYQADIFIRPARAEGVPFDAGIGTNFFIGPMAGFVPYLQVGFPLSQKAYLYTTQGPTFLARQQSTGFNHPWMSVVSVEFSASALQLGAMFGQMDEHRSFTSSWTPPRFFAQFLMRRKILSLPWWTDPRPRPPY